MYSLGVYVPHSMIEQCPNFVQSVASNFMLLYSYSQKELFRIFFWKIYGKHSQIKMTFLTTYPNSPNKSPLCRSYPRVSKLSISMSLADSLLSNSENTLVCCRIWNQCVFSCVDVQVTHMFYVSENIPCFMYLRTFPLVFDPDLQS